MREIIVEVLARVMEQETSTITDATILRDIDGFDSLRFVMMISELQEDYNIEIPLDKALEVETVGQLIANAKQI